MKEEGCGLDCATKVELMMAKACGFTGHDVMFFIQCDTGR